MATKPRTSVVDTLLDDASLGRIDATDAIMRLQHDVVAAIKNLRAILAGARSIDASLNEVMVALLDIRELHPTVSGRRTDLETVVAA